MMVERTHATKCRAWRFQDHQQELGPEVKEFRSTTNEANNQLGHNTWGERNSASSLLLIPSPIAIAAAALASEAAFASAAAWGQRIEEHDQWSEQSTGS
jgi:hypothetical protein